MRTPVLFLTALLFASSSGASAAKHRRTAHKPAGHSAKRAVARGRGRTAHSTHHAVAAPAVSTQERLSSTAFVQKVVAVQPASPLENGAALVPFFEQLYRLQQGGSNSGLHILHYGDSHTASDDWAQSMRSAFQEKFGCGGPGFSLAGRPYSSYRRRDLQSNSSAGWYTDGLVGRTGDGRYGLGGISLTTDRAQQSVALDAEGELMELFYLQQPGGGALEFSDNGHVVDTISTKGELGPGYYRYFPAAGPHHFELRTTEYAPVRLFGWSLDNRKGVTVETLGINGAQAPIQLKWDEPILDSNMARRNPALILVAYGTNEANAKDWTPETYRAAFHQVLQRLRRAAPVATILVIGPPDRYYRVKGRAGWQPWMRTDMIIDAEREVALADGCVFYDLRERMGGAGSMPRWVNAGLGQYDYTHLTRDGYHAIGQVIFQDLMAQYARFVELRSTWPEKQTNGQTSTAADNH